jgi:osmotically-inducible protein OsmY
VTSLITAFTLSACDRADNTETAGQKLDRNIAEARQSGDEAKQSAEQMGRDVKNSTERAANKVGTELDDSAITASVKAKLAADAKLSALDIQVVTEKGDVMLTGKAPSDADRARATTLASSVQGVRAVENHLLLDPGKS